VRGRPTIVAFCLWWGTFAALGVFGCAGSASTTTVVSVTTGPTTSSGSTAGASTTTLPAREPPAAEADLTVDVVATGLVVPWEMRPDGTLSSPTTGSSGWIDLATGQSHGRRRSPLRAGKAGLMGLLDPDYPRDPTSTWPHPCLGGDVWPTGQSYLPGSDINDEKDPADGTPGGSIHDSRVAFAPMATSTTTGDAGQAISPTEGLGRRAAPGQNGSPAPGSLPRSCTPTGTAMQGWHGTRHRPGVRHRHGPVTTTRSTA
jgi:hypothetical protein